MQIIHIYRIVAAMESMQSKAKAAYVDGVAREHVADNGADGSRARKEKAKSLAEVHSEHLPPDLAITPAEFERGILRATPRGDAQAVGTLEENMCVAVENFKSVVQPGGMPAYCFTFTPVG